MSKPVLKETESALKLDEMKAYHDILDQQQLRNHQNWWSFGIAGLMCISTFLCWLFIFNLGGCEYKYEAYPYFPEIVITTFFAQIVGLGLIVSKCLFPKRF